MNLESSTEAEFDAYERANSKLLSLIGGGDVSDGSTTTWQQRAVSRLARSRDLLESQGNPHLRYPVVHVTGTSGKGSTCAAIASILTAAGYRVGLRTSPYMQVATEKLKIGSKLIDGISFHTKTIEVLDLWQSRRNAFQVAGRLGYSEAWSSIAFSWFAERRVDVAVVEVGAGGRFDATNVVDPIVSVITSVGLDHVATLGPTMEDIAWHKAGIIKPGVPAVVGQLPAAALAIIAQSAAENGSSLVSVSSIPASSTSPIGMPGSFQIPNARTAATVTEVLRQRGFTIPPEAVSVGLRETRLPGRLERMPGCNAPRIWIDGAHNPDKIAALRREVPHLGTAGQLPVIVLGVLGVKDAAVIASRLQSAASAFVATEPTVKGKRQLPSEELAATLRSTGFQGPIFSEPDPLKALCRAELLARDRDLPILVTGSLYLCGQVRRRWYPDELIVTQRTPWPVIDGT